MSQTLLRSCAVTCGPRHHHVTKAAVRLSPLSTSLFTAKNSRLYVATNATSALVAKNRGTELQLALPTRNAGKDNGYLTAVVIRLREQHGGVSISVADGPRYARALALLSRASMILESESETQGKEVVARVARCHRKEMTHQDSGVNTPLIKGRRLCMTLEVSLRDKQESSQTPPTLRVKGASDVGKVAKAVAEVLKAGGEGSSVKVAGVGASAAAVMLSAVVTARNVLIHHSGLDVDIVTERFNLEHAHDAAEAGSKPVTHGLCVTVRAVPAVQQQADSGDA